MKILFAVNSWHVAAQRGFHQVIRETWGKDVAPADLRFFIPRVPNHALQNDEVFLDVPFDYEHVCREVQEMLRWSVQHDYDFTVILSTDSFVIPQKILSCGFEQYDYSGDFAFSATDRSKEGNVPFGELSSHTTHCTFMTEEGFGVHRHLYDWAGGGIARMLSRRASAVIAESTKEAEYWHAADDIMIGQILGPLIKNGEITAWRVPNFGDKITFHYKSDPETSGITYGSETGWMQKMYTQHKESV